MYRIIEVSPKVLTWECCTLLLAFNILVQVMYQKTVVDDEKHTHTSELLQTSTIKWG